MDERLRREYPKRGARACAELMQLTIGQVASRAQALGVKCYTRALNWTPAEDDVLRERYAIEGVEGCVGHLPGRKRKAIEYRAARIGLTRRNYVGGGHAPRPVYDHRALARALGMLATPPEPGAVLERHYLRS
jgi:hypothetical protein